MLKLVNTIQLNILKLIPFSKGQNKPTTRKNPALTISDTPTYSKDEMS